LPPYNKVIIVVKASDLGLSPGDTISFVSGVTQSTDPGATVGAGATALYDQMPDSLVFTNSYALTNNELCRPNTAPTASLTATPASGEAPLLVQFNGSGSSDPDTDAPADTIASYTFDFGDGSDPVTQSGPTVSHNYTKSGNYFATLRVKDSRNKVSENSAKVVIEVSNALPTVSIASPANNASFETGSDITINVNASDNGSVSKVEFFEGTNKLGEDTAGPPWSFAWNDVAAGSYVLTAKATDDEGATKTSDPVNITVSTTSNPVTLTSLTLTPIAVAGTCAGSQGKVTISAPAPAGGVLVTLANNNPSAATIPASVTVPTGSTVKTFNVVTKSVSTRQLAKITATLGAVNLSKTLTVNPIFLKDFVLNPNPVRGPQYVSAVLTLDCPAPAGGLTVSLSSSNPAVASPTVNSIVIPKGKANIAFKVRTSRVTSAKTVSIKATLNGKTKIVSLKVNP
jgi:PKD repeat protein